MSTVYAKAERLQKEKEAKERKKAKKERLEQEGLETKHLEKERMEKECLAKEADEQRLGLEKEEADKKAATAAESQLQDGKAEVNEEGDVIEEKRPLDRTEAKKVTITAFSTALATARIISDISIVPYPEGVSSPLPELNQNAKEGKFRYDPDFLLQFMSFCKEKPATLAPDLDVFGIDPKAQAIRRLGLTRGGSGRHRASSGTIPPSRQASIGLGFSPSTLGKGAINSMGNFAIVRANKLGNRDDRFAASTRAASVSGAGAMQFARPMTTTASTGGPGTRERTRSKRGEKRGKSNKVPGGSQQNQGSGSNNYQKQQQANSNLEKVAPVQASANRWDRRITQTDAVGQRNQSENAKVTVGHGPGT